MINTTIKSSVFIKSFTVLKLNIFLNPEMGLIRVKSSFIASVASLKRDSNKEGIVPTNAVTTNIGKMISKKLLILLQYNFLM